MKRTPPLSPKLAIAAVLLVPLVALAEAAPATGAAAVPSAVESAAGAPAPEAPTFGAVNWIVLAAYLGGVVALGAWFSRREKSTDDYFLAGRRVPWWAAGLSIFGGGLSAITYMAIPGKAFAADWVTILRNVVPLAIIPLVVLFYIPFYRRLKVTTAYEYLEKRFNYPVRAFASGLFVVFQFGRMAIVLVLPAMALSTVTGMDLYLAIVLMGVLATVYTVLGGIEAVIWTDVLQVIVLMGAAIMCLCVILADAGGLAAVVRVGAADGKFHTVNWTWDYAAPALWVMVVGNFFGQFMPNTADQSVVQRYLTTRDERAARRAAWTSALLNVPTGLLFFFLGTSLYAFYKANPHLRDPSVANDAILPFFVMQNLPAGISGLVIAGIFAAAMSSVDSSMNSIATAVTTDGYRRWRRLGGEGEYLLFARLVTVAAGAVATGVAVLVAAAGVASLLDLFFYVLFLVGGSLGGLFVLGIFTRRASGVGALIGAGAGMAAAIGAWKLTPIHAELYAGVGLAVTVVVGYLASLPFAPRRDTTGLTVYSMPAEA